MTDALDLPGTTGIVHSRPGFDFFSTTHPYLDNDEKLALVTNGSFSGTATPEYYAEMRAVADELLDKGIRSRVSDDIKPEGFYEKFMTKDGRAFWSPELRAFTVGHAAACAEENKKRAIADALKESYERLPGDQIALCVHADVPDTVSLCTVTRPMSVLKADGECYLASCAIAFPEDVKGEVTHLPQCSVVQVTPSGIDVVYDRLDGVRCEPVTEEIIDAFIKMFEEQTKDEARGVYELTKPNAWHEPMIDCDRFRAKEGKLKPIMPAFYQAAYRLYKQGRLSFHVGRLYARNVAWPSKDCYFTKFKVT